uniref:Immunoglobulin V-set domain-containing protein n=1 Tax=Sparus aurata TaxID=8175 RepID=A0A671TZS4_SPAAU
RERNFHIQVWFHSMKCISLHSGVSGEELSLDKNEESSLEDSTVTLSYTNSKRATGSDQFYWYRQYSGKPPEFLFYISGLNDTRPAESLKSDTKFSTKLSEEKRGVYLQISSAAVTDSAVYYCAVRPTVTGNTKTLYKNTS